MKLEPKIYISWYGKFSNLVNTELKRNSRLMNKEERSKEDLIPVFSKTFLSLLNALIHEDEDENARVAIKLIDTIENFISGEGLYAIYGGENALPESKDDLIYAITLLSNRGLVKPCERIWNSELIAPENLASGAYYQELRNPVDVKNYLLCACRYFKTNIIKD